MDITEGRKRTGEKYVTSSFIICVLYSIEKGS
jgi:hypothetical protein